MSVAQPGQAGLHSSSTLSLNLSSNNPFRKSAATPFSEGQRSPFDAPPRPVSRNPFLDASATSYFSQQPVASPDKMAFGKETNAPPRSALTGNAAELFDNLALDDKPAPSSSAMRAPPRPNRDAMPPSYSTATRGENIPPRGPPRGPGHRPTKSQEDAMRARRAGTGSLTTRSRPTEELDIFADPAETSSPRREGSRRPLRRNSESSISERPVDPEEEKKRRERRHRERERRHRERDSKDPKTKKPDRKLDIIDKLDVTSIYGTGLFHHDGPFDACNPHRNRTGSKRAPMQAFPKDSLNNILGGGGPLNKRPDHATFLGQADEEAFKDYSTGGIGATGGFEPYNGIVSKEPDIMNATTRVEPIHGEETLGLGTSTFLEGAPASRTAMQRREAEQTSPTEGGGLGRKKSLAQKIRGINTNRRDYGPQGRITSPEGVYSPPARITPGGTRHESNPFFNEFSKGDDIITTKKEGAIAFVEPERIERTRGPGSPKRFGGPLERRATSDGGERMMEPPAIPSRSSGGGGGGGSGGGGFLSRVKSLKSGPKKPKAIPQAQES